MRDECSKFGMHVVWSIFSLCFSSTTCYAITLARFCELGLLDRVEFSGSIWMNFLYGCFFQLWYYFFLFLTVLKLWRIFNLWLDLISLEWLGEIYRKCLNQNKYLWKRRLHLLWLFIFWCMVMMLITQLTLKNRVHLFPLVPTWTIRNATLILLHD